MICPKLGIDIKLRTGWGFKTDVEKIAVQIRSALGLQPHDRLPARALAKRMNLAVVEPASIPGLAPALLSELVEMGSGRWSAVLLKDADTGTGLIINNPTHSAVRQESNIFHEIGHDLCRHEPDDIEYVSGLPVRVFNDEKEKQAEAVAYALHISRDALFWAAKQRMTREAIGAHFHASSQLVQLRINGTGVQRIVKRVFA